MIISIISHLETFPSCMQKVQPKCKNFSSISTATTPVLFFLSGRLLSIVSFNLHYNSWQEGHPGLPAAALQDGHAVQHGELVALPVRGFTGNFYARYTNGNKSNKGIKLSHWNAGSAFLENKVNEIETLISGHHPHLLGISEANLRKDHNIGNCMIEDYELITSKTMNNLNLQVSRVVVYKHTSVVAKVREDLMSDKFSSIWLEVGFPGRTKMLVCNLYRDWQILGTG